MASQEGHVDVVRVLLEQGAVIDNADDDGYTPLYVASQEGHVDVVRMLLEQMNHTEIIRLQELAAQVRPSSPSQVS